MHLTCSLIYVACESYKSILRLCYVVYRSTVDSAPHPCRVLFLYRRPLQIVPYCKASRIPVSIPCAVGSAEPQNYAQTREACMHVDDL